MLKFLWAKFLKWALLMLGMLRGAIVGGVELLFLCPAKLFEQACA